MTNLTTATTNIFVYGTLRRDGSHQLFHLLARYAQFLGEATVHGRLYDLGDYPGMTYPERSRVFGEVYAVAPAQWKTVITRLDEYEGCSPADPEPREYRREVIEAELPGGEMVPAWAYILNFVSPSMQEIRSGDYLASRVGSRA